MTRRLRVYVAGPIDGSGKHISNLRRALDAGTQLMAAGFDPFIPHLNLIWALVQEDATPGARWQEWDDNWLSCCDALYRLQGESPGSDHEVRLAYELNIPVFFEKHPTGGFGGMESLTNSVFASRKRT